MEVYGVVAKLQNDNGKNRVVPTTLNYKISMFVARLQSL